MSIAATIRDKLMIAIRPTRLDVINDSHLHAGHRSSPGYLAIDAQYARDLARWDDDGGARAPAPLKTMARQSG